MKKKSTIRLRSYGCTEESHEYYYYEFTHWQLMCIAKLFMGSQVRDEYEKYEKLLVELDQDRDGA